MYFQRIIKSFLLLSVVSTSYASDDLIRAYEDALLNDTIFQQATYQYKIDKRNLTIAIGAVLPQINLTASPSVSRMASPNPINSSQRLHNSQRGYDVQLTATQTIFNFSQFAQIAGSNAYSKAAGAILNAALQDLMVRTAQAYFQVLKDDDNLRYSEVSKIALKEQLRQIKQKYKVGLSTVTDVYTAEASYESAVANAIEAQTQLDNDKENLSLITGQYYTNFKTLKDDFPLVVPDPQNEEVWVETAKRQNWKMISSRYKVEAARQKFKEQFSKHLPNLSFSAVADRSYNSINNIAPTSLQRNGVTTTQTAMLTLNVPIFSGGQVMALADQASNQYKIALQQNIFDTRQSINSTRKSYHEILAGVSQIKADKQTVRSTISSLKGLEASYQVGTETLVNVLNQQQKVYEAQRKYAQDRYDFVLDILRLKQAAGVLNFADLKAINTWLIPHKKEEITDKSLLQGSSHPLTAAQIIEKK